MTKPINPYEPHDHNHCVTSAMDEAIQLCRQKNARLTQIRARVLELVWQAHKPLGAYELLSALEQEGHKPAPPTIYRALDFLQEMGLVHRIASLNAFIGCCDPGQSHSGAFLICRQCMTTQEIVSETLDKQIEAACAARGFKTEHRMLEISGLCPNCQDIKPQ